jgi:hypothetical protein
MDGAVIVPAILVILFLGFYPQFALHRSEASARVTVAAAQLEQLHEQLEHGALRAEQPRCPRTWAYETDEIYCRANRDGTFALWVEARPGRGSSIGNR